MLGLSWLMTLRTIKAPCFKRSTIASMQVSISIPEATRSIRCIPLYWLSSPLCQCPSATVSLIQTAMPLLAHPFGPLQAHNHSPQATHTHPAIAQNVGA